MNAQINAENPKTLSEFVLEFLKHRVSDPLWRSFVVFFLIHNWKAVAALLLGNVSNPVERISHAKYYLESNTFLTFNMCGQEYWIVPLGFSILFIYFYLKYIKPKVVEKYNVNNNLSLESAIKELKGKQDEIDKLENEKQNEINKLNNIISETKSYVNILDKFIREKLKFNNFTAEFKSNYPNRNIGDKLNDENNQDIRKIIDGNEFYFIIVDIEEYQNYRTKINKTESV